MAKYLNGVQETNDAAIQAIQAKTDLIPASPASTSDITTAHSTTDGKIDDVAADVTNLLAITGTPVRKIVTFSNTTDDVTLFTVTGSVRVKLLAVCTTSLASSGGCTIGLKAGNGELIAATASTDIVTGEIWADATPASKLERYNDAVLDYVIGDGADIVLDVETAKQVDSGELVFYVAFEPITSNGNVVATV